jgi:hypothetical protein
MVSIITIDHQDETIQYNTHAIANANAMQSVSPCRAGGSPRFKMGGRRRHDVRAVRGASFACLIIDGLLGRIAKPLSVTTQQLAACLYM